MRHVLLFMIGTLALGCSPFDTTRSLMWWKDDEPRPPAKITPMWTDTVMYQSGMPPVRGFGGRVMFFDNHSEEPIKVEGTLTVYAFDGTSPDSAGTVPERKYVFPAEDLEKHYSESKLGPSYSFWLPWDEVGGHERQLTLVARFEPLDGGPTMSQPSRHYLPGLPMPKAAPVEESAPLAANKAARAEKTTTAEHPVQPASFNDAPSENAAAARMSTVTIDVPPNFIRHTQGDSHGGEELPVTPMKKPASQLPPLESDAAREPAENVAPPNTVGEDAASQRPTSLSTLPRRERVRRQPFRASWLPALPTTPRAQTPDRWPGLRPTGTYGERSWSDAPAEQPSAAMAEG